MALCVAFVLLASVLSFPVSGDSEVLILRHCVRSQYPTLFEDHAAPGFNYPSNYTARPFPSAAEWRSDGVATCTPRGKSLAQSFGKSLDGKLTGPVSIVVDNVTRCIQTAEEILSGLSLPKSAVTIKQAIFDPVKAGICAPLTDLEKEDSIREQLTLAQSHGSYLHEAWRKREALKAELQELVGHGKAPSIATLEDHVANGYYEGGMYAASQAMIETFILEAGAGLETAWGELDGTRRSELWSKWQSLNVLFNRINHGGSHMATRLGGATFWHIFQLLNDAAGTGSTVMVGHDTTLDAMAKLAHLEWQCGPFAPNGATPLSGLLFKREKDNLTIEAVCESFDGNSVGVAVFGTTWFDSKNVSSEPTSFDAFKSSVQGRLDSACLPHHRNVVV